MISAHTTYQGSTNLDYHVNGRLGTEMCEGPEGGIHPTGRRLRRSTLKYVLFLLREPTDTGHRRERNGIAGGENRLYEGTERGKKMVVDFPQELFGRGNSGCRALPLPWSKSHFLREHGPLGPKGHEEALANASLALPIPPPASLPSWLPSLLLALSPLTSGASGPSDFYSKVWGSLDG